MKTHASAKAKPAKAAELDPIRVSTLKGNDVKGVLPAGVSGSPNLTLILEHTANVDIRDGGYWETPVDPERTTVPVADIPAAQKTFEDWRQRNGLGGGNITRDCGTVMDKNKPVARFSYNGRLWTLEEWPNCKEIVIEPAPDQRPIIGG